MDLLKPCLAVLLAATVFAGALLAFRRRGLRGVSAALVVAFLLGLGTTRLIPYVRDPLRHTETHDGFAYTPVDRARPIPDGAVSAARWLRDHSDPADRVATNAHCRSVIKGVCDNRHFWVAAYTERRILVESWGYTSTNNATKTSGSIHVLPYSRPDVLADNDRVFTTPSEAAAKRLREGYGVRWLFVDRVHEPPAATLGSVARLRFESGDAAVYELTGPTR